MMDYNNNDSQYIEEAKDLVINSIGKPWICMVSTVV